MIANYLTEKQRMCGQLSMKSDCRVPRLSAVLRATFIVAAILLVASPLHAASYTWRVQSGNWSAASNWGGTVPGSGDSAYIVNGGTTTISTTMPSCGTISLGTSSGTGCVQMTGGSALSGTGSFPAGYLYVGFSGNGAYVQSGGTNTAVFIYLGYNAGCQGTYTLNGPALITNPNYGGYSGANEEYIGWSGIGTFNQTGGKNGGTNGSGGFFYLGYNSGAMGTYNLSGTGNLLTAGEDIGYSGSGSFLQSGGTNSAGDPTAVYSNSPSIYLGYYAGATGSYTLTGGQLLVDNSSSNATSEYIGYSGTGSFTQSGGVNSVSSTTSTVGLYLAYSASSSGSYSLSGTGQLLATSEYIGTSGTGSVTQTGGTNTVGKSLSLGYQGGEGIYSLDGGLLLLSSLSGGPGPAIFDFGGGTLQATAALSSTLAMTLTGSGGNACINTAGYAVTLAGPLIGPAGLTKTGSGFLTLTATNTFTGNTLVVGGSLVLGTPLAVEMSTLDTSGSGALSFGSLTSATFGGLTGPGTLKLSNTASSPVALSVGNNNSNTTFSGMLQGAGSLSKLGSGILALAGSNTYSGPTTINQGELVVNGSIASPVTVNAGGILGGAGHVTSVTVSGSGQLAPGDAIGDLTLTGSLSLLSGAIMDYELDTPGTSDEILMPGELLSLNGQQFSNFDFTWTSNSGPGIYDLIEFGSSSGSLGTNKSGTIDGYSATLAIQGNELVLNVTPEPSPLALLGSGALGLLGYGWRRRLRRATTRIKERTDV
jgi:autotransporter-associated beta strand protein